MNAEQPAVVAEGWDLEPAVEVASEHVHTPEGTEEQLQADLKAALSALRKVMNTHPSQFFSGSPQNKHFGKKIILCYEKQKQIAGEALQAQGFREMERMYHTDAEPEVEVAPDVPA